MKFGTLFAYWVREWKGDYVLFAKKVAKIGFDILEVSAGQLLKMSNKELDELRSLTKDLGISITSNIGPAKNKDVSSKSPAVRKAGITNLTRIMHAMDRLDSRVLAGVLYSYWPCDFVEVDKKAAWELGIASVRELSRTAELLGIDLCLEVVNRFETYILNTSEEALRYCKAVHSKRVKILLDTFHMNIEEDNIGDAIRLAGPYLGHLHVGEGNRKVPGRDISRGMKSARRFGIFTTTKGSSWNHSFLRAARSETTLRYGEISVETLLQKEWTRK